MWLARVAAFAGFRPDTPSVPTPPLAPLAVRIGRLIRHNIVEPEVGSGMGVTIEVWVRAYEWPVANFFRPVCERREKAGWPNFWLWIGLPDARISIHSCADAGSAKRNGPVANFFRPVCELRQKAVWP